MARSAAPITLSSRAPEISLDELTTCLAEASAILWAVKLRREQRLQECDQLRLTEIPKQEEQTPAPKELGL